MADGVAEIQNRARARSVPFVPGHDRRFDLDIAPHEFQQDRCALKFSRSWKSDGSAMIAVLDDLRETLVELPRRQRPKSVDIGHAPCAG